MSLPPLKLIAVNFMIENNVPYIRDDIPCDCRDYIKILLIYKGNENEGLLHAAKIGDSDLALMFIYKGARNYNCAMIRAAEYSNKDIVQILLAKGATDYNKIAISAARNGSKEILQMMLDLGEKSYDIIMANAATANGPVAKEIIQWMIDLGAKAHGITMRIAAGAAREDIVDWMSQELEKHGPEDYRGIDPAKIEWYKSNHYSLAADCALISSCLEEFYTGNKSKHKEVCLRIYKKLKEIKK